jgi:hypothetical protein
VDEMNIDLRSAVVGDKFDTNDNQSCVIVAKTNYNLCFELLDGAELLFITGEDGVPERSNYKHLAIKSKYEPRHWLKDLPDAGLLAIYGTEFIELNEFGKWFAVNKHQCTALCNDLMPTLTGDEWRNSKISIDELKAWQKENKTRGE